MTKEEALDCMLALDAANAAESFIEKNINMIEMPAEVLTKGFQTLAEDGTLWTMHCLTVKDDPWFFQKFFHKLVEFGVCYYPQKGEEK